MTQILRNNNKTYFLIKKIGSGAYSKVWAAYSMHHKCNVAIKIIRTSETRAGLNEVNTYRNMSKFDGIINMLDSFMFSESIHIVFELMSCSMYDIINKGYIDFISLEHLTKTITNTIDDLHKNNIIHGDIKPENILIRFADNKFGFNEELFDLEKSIKSIKSNRRKKNNKNNNKNIEKKIENRIRIFRNKYSLTFVHNYDDFMHTSDEVDDSDNSDNSDNEEYLEDSENNKNNNNNNESDNSEYYSTSTEFSDNINDRNIDSDSISDQDISDSDDSASSDTEGLSDDSEPIDIFDYQECFFSDDCDSSALSIRNSNTCFTFTPNDRIVLSDMSTSFNITTDKLPRSIHTCYYRPPEVILGCNYDHTADIWALGCSFYELLTGKILFRYDDYEFKGEDEKRVLLQMMNAMLDGNVNMYYDDSIYPDVFFKTNREIKSHNGKNYDNKKLIRKLFDNIHNSKTVTNYVTQYSSESAVLEYVNMILSMITIDASSRNHN